MRSWSEVCQNTLRLFGYGDICYLYGAYDQIGSDSLVDQLWNLYPDHFKKYVTDRGFTRQQLKDHVRGKRCFDCSAFVSYVCGLQMHVTTAALQGRFWYTCSPRDGVYGAILWKSGHVAIDTGFGTCVECVSEFNDLKLNLIRERDFVLSGRIPEVDYTGSINL